jgi:hypothetical protein
MSSRTVLSTSCNHDVALAAGIFNRVYGSIGVASRFAPCVPTSALRAHAYKLGITGGRRLWRLRLLWEGHGSAGLEHQRHGDFDTVHRHLNGERHRLVAFCVVGHTRKFSRKRGLKHLESL